MSKYTEDYEESNEQMIKEIQEGTFIEMDYFGSNVTDAFAAGEKYGYYTAQKERNDK